MFKYKNYKVIREYSNGRKTEIMFGFEKPYPKKKTVKRIVKLLDFYMEKYKGVSILLIGDGLSTKEREKEFGLIKRIINKNGVDVEISSTDDTIRALHTILPSGKDSIIAFNTYSFNEFCNWNFMPGKPGESKLKRIEDINITTNKDYIQYIFIHEFAHAIETQYKIYENEELIQLYEKHYEKFKSVSEFIVECFVVSENYLNNEIANKVRKIVDSIAL